MSRTKKEYIISTDEIMDKIAEFEHSGDYLIARGLYIAAELAGIDITSSTFSDKISKKILNISIETRKRARIRLKS